MTTEFKVLPWLREIRDRHARETEGMRTEERVAALERETHDWTAAFRRAHPEAFVYEPFAQARVAEKPEVYGGKAGPPRSSPSCPVACCATRDARHSVNARNYRVSRVER